MTDAVAVAKPPAGLRIPAGIVSLAVSAVVIVAAFLATLGSSPGAFPLAAMLDVFGAGMYLVIGSVAWWRRPQNRTGALMVAAGLTWLLVDLKLTSSSLLFTIGDVLGNMTYAVIGHLGMAFPSGRLQSSRERAVIVAVYLWTLAGTALPVITGAPPACHCVHDLLAINPNAATHEFAIRAQEIGNIIVAAVVVVVVIGHRMRASAPARRAMAPAIWASGPILAVVVGLNIGDVALSPSWLPGVLPVVTPLALASLPVVFVIGLLRARLSTGVGHLVVELANPQTGDLRSALARALGDPGLGVAYRTATGAWVDTEGRPVSLPRTDDARTVTMLERDDQPVAALIHDRSLENDPTLVSAVAAAASLAVENERLKAELRAQLAEVESSRTRIAGAADAERRRIERDLHDGAQQRLLRLAMDLDRVRNHGEATVPVADAVGDAITHTREILMELRELAAGIRPAVLTDAGLGPALEALAERAPIPTTVHSSAVRRYGDAVEAAAYYAASEAIANAAKHSHAEHVTVTTEEAGGRLTVSVADDGRGGADPGGHGLRGLADRLEAVGGSLDVESPPEGGTLLRFRLPCG